MSQQSGKPEKSRHSDSAVMRPEIPLPPSEDKSLAAQILGQKGGLRRAATLSPERRSEIARVAAKRRWEKGSSA